MAGRERDVTLNCSARLNLTVLTRGRIGYDFQWEDGNNGTVVETGERTTITTAPSIPSVISYSVLTLSPLSIVDTNFTCTVMVMEMQGALRDSDLGAANLLLNVTSESVTSFACIMYHSPQQLQMIQ